MTTASEKYDERVRIWKSPSGVRFASQSVEQGYRQRVQMLVDAIELKKPERVPVALNVGFYACTYAGITPKEGTYDYAKLAYAIKKFNADFLPDTLTSAFYCGPGKALEIVDYVDPDIPAGKTLWIFDQTDMKEVKKHLSGWACFGGNVPSSLLRVAGPQEVKDCVKRLIDEVGQDGGYILSNGAVLDEAKPENLHALIDFAKGYGIYT
jgi:hypothetical protein